MKLGSAINNKKNKLTNDYFSGLASNINAVAEARKVEEEFRLAKSYTMHKNVTSNLTTSAEFFEDHLKERPVYEQPEVMNPELYPHILPPDDINTNSDIPTISEVDEARKKAKKRKMPRDFYAIDHNYMDNLYVTVILDDFLDNLSF